MLVNRIFKFTSIIRWTWFHLTYAAIYGAIAHYFYVNLGMTFLAIPWLPISLIGIAVSFYVGFKNNSAYDRAWEARKIWGSIVNTSRAFGSMTHHFISSLHSSKEMNNNDIKNIHKRLIFRHISWLYQLRDQLLKPTRWEHLNGNWSVKKLNTKRRNLALGAFNILPVTKILGKFLTEKDLQYLEKSPNRATSLLDRQSLDFKDLRKDELIDDFRHMGLQKALNEFYADQGKLERIKNFPLPRSYASISYYFVTLFVLLLPFGLLPEFEKLGPGYNWLMIPFSAVISWVFILMEIVGDYTENPFEGLPGDTPMYSICRNIERDLLYMIGEDDIPPVILPQGDILM